MSRRELTAVAIFLFATVGAIVGIFAVEGIRRATGFHVTLLARAPENGNWHPRTVTIPAGEEVKILIRNIDTVTHGFAVPDLNIAVKEIKAGEVKVVSLKAPERGTYPFMCTVWCSDRHMQMRGQLVAE
jgi:heme/copper-type cytochrome/quinol oxidase subunit 2